MKKGHSAGVNGQLQTLTPADGRNSYVKDIAAALPQSLVQFEGFHCAGHGVGDDQPERYYALLGEFVTAPS